MIGFTWLLCGPLFFFGPQAPPARECFELVKKLDSAAVGERDRIKEELANRPNAVWAVSWGSRHQDVDIAIPCLEILEEWHWQARFAKMVRSVDGDFDRFINSFLDPSPPNFEFFERASEKGRAFDRYFVRKTYLAHPTGFPKGFGSLGDNGRGLATPFHYFSAYFGRHRPATIQGFLRPPRGEERPCLAKCDGVKTSDLIHSIVISEGYAEVDAVSTSLVVCGSDVSIGSEAMYSSLIIAAGDVTLKGNVGQVFVIAGGTLTVQGHVRGALFVSPKKIELARRGSVSPVVILMDGQRKPAPEFFTLSDLWTDHGLEATFDQGWLAIKKVKAGGAMAKFFKQEDTILALAGKKLESLGQFRRLLRYSRDTGQLDIDAIRARERVRIQAELKQNDVDR